MRLMKEAMRTREARFPVLSASQPQRLGAKIRIACITEVTMPIWNALKSIDFR